MTRPAALSAILAAALIAAVLPAAAPADAQVLEGRVVLAGWEEPVVGAHVILLDAELTTAATTTAGADGTFAFTDVAPGTYHLQAQHEGLFSSVSSPVEVNDDVAAAGAIVLTLPSPLLELARGCFRAAREPGTGVVTGVAFEAATEMPLPYARVRVQWEREGAARGQRTTTADGSGRFALCSVPAGTRVSAWVEALGGVTRVETDFVVTRNAIARLDLPMELGRVASVRVVRTATGERDGRLVVQGRVLDAATVTPVAAALVALGEDGRQFVTDRQGRFQFADVAPGSHTIAVRGLGYDLEPQPLELPEAAVVELELRVSPQALALAPLVVRMFSPEERAIRATPHARRVIAGERLLFAEQRGARVHDVLREFPGVQVIEPPPNRRGFSTGRGPALRGPCIQSSRPAIIPLPGSPNPECRMVEVFLDGVSIGAAPDLLMSLPLMDLESIEFLHPLHAMQWGYEARLYGALLLWTRGRGPHVNQARNPESRRR